jgi:GDP-L-fucose synthase
MNNKKTIITGSTGLIGSALTKKLSNNKLYVTSGDLTDCQKIYQTFLEWSVIANGGICKNVFHKLEEFDCFHLAARVGGVNANMSYLGEFFTSNILINTNVLNAARMFKVRKLISLASTCIYPENASQPLKECDLHNGWPHESNYGYAFAKRMLDIQSKAYRDQYGCNFIVAIPTNVFGLNDNFNLENSHVIPGMIHKIYLAKINKQPILELWGDGSQLRDFIFADDLCDALVLVMENYDDKEPINIASGIDISIKEIAELIQQNMEYDGKIIWSGDKTGIQKKSVNIDKITALGWKPKTNVQEGLRIVCEEFVSKYPNVRK